MVALRARFINPAPRMVRSASRLVHRSSRNSTARAGFSFEFGSELASVISLAAGIAAHVEGVADQEEADPSFCRKVAQRFDILAAPPAFEGLQPWAVMPSSSPIARPMRFLPKSSARMRPDAAIYLDCNSAMVFDAPAGQDAVIARKRYDVPMRAAPLRFALSACSSSPYSAKARKSLPSTQLP